LRILLVDDPMGNLSPLEEQLAKRLDRDSGFSSGNDEQGPLVIASARKEKPEGLGPAFTSVESDRLVDVYECSVCHVLFGRHAPQCPVCHHGALSLVGSLLSEK